ncbi:hypothetical protein [Variovorax sp. PCZ-1]|uniref:hypothetical protein n=1 Tax=Variovorax sp. PCZ-1 TaxID=2835533 RepID=UPI001BCF74BB|nr:hypothetical protein [Variovorax sp. PCZ-1]MBS7807571.1 hypothetical protein [Variovorax sp. PCZ-1]
MKIKKSQEGIIDVVIWVCIYGGLLSVVGALAIANADEDAAYWLGGVGSLVTVVGCILVYIRSRS